MLSLRYVNAREHKLTGRLSLKISEREHSVFAFVVHGAVKITWLAGQERRTDRAAEGEVFLITPDWTCTLEHADARMAHVVTIRFQSGERLADARTVSWRRLRMPRLRNWVGDLLLPNPKQALAHELLLQSHLYAIAAEFAAMTGKPRGADDNLIHYVMQIKQSMLENCSAPMDMEEVARLSGASSARFYQMFKRYTGLSPLKYMTTVRLNESLCMLANQASSVKEAAHAVGYSDELYFSRLFKKQMGISPTEYAASAQRRIANLCPVFRGDLTVLGLTPVLELSREWYDDPDKEAYLRQVEHARPDLILTAPVSEELHQALSQIAPVLMIKWKGYSWKERLRDIARAVSLPTVAERWLVHFQQKVENASKLVRKQLEELPFLIVSMHEPFFRVYGMQRMKVRDLFYDELQVTPPSAVDPILFLDVPKLEEVAALECDNILLLVPDTLSDDRCLQVEEEWRDYKQNRPDAHCIVIRHEEPLLYNAAFYESLIDQFVDQLLLHRG